MNEERQIIEERLHLLPSYLRLSVVKFLEKKVRLLSEHERVCCEIVTLSTDLERIAQAEEWMEEE